MNTKQIIVIRKDLGMRRGKEISQGGHASMAFLTQQIKDEDYPLDVINNGASYNISLNSEEINWINNSFVKICCYVNSREELMEIYQKSIRAGLTTHLITDDGRTEFHGVPTPTCLAIGPHESSKIDEITKSLSLY